MSEIAEYYAFMKLSSDHKMNSETSTPRAVLPVKLGTLYVSNTLSKKFVLSFSYSFVYQS